MNADSIRDAVFAIADAGRASAQAAHDARQPEIDRLKRAIKDALAAVVVGDTRRAQQLLCAALKGETP